MPQSRNHSEEYRRRIQSGQARGLTRQAARGHASAKRAKDGGKATFDPKLEAALRQLRKPGASISEVSKDAHVSRERLSRYVKAVAGAHRDGKIWRFDDRRLRKMAIIEADELDPVVCAGARLPGSPHCWASLSGSGSSPQAPKEAAGLRSPLGRDSASTTSKVVGTRYPPTSTKYSERS